MNLQNSPETAVLTCWKDIARYFGKGVRTVQRWERHLGLPVRRPDGIDHKSAVVAYPRDLDEWLHLRWSRRGIEEIPASDRTGIKRQVLFAELLHGLRVSHALRQELHSLRKEHHELVHQLSSSVTALRQSCQQSLWAANHPSGCAQKPPAKVA